MPSQVYNTGGGYQTWTWPAGVTTVIAECLGGGSWGGTASGNPSTGGGGKGASYARKTITKTSASLDVRAGLEGQNSKVELTAGGTMICNAASALNGADATVNSTNGAGATGLQFGPNVGDVFYEGGNGGTGNFTSGVGGSGAAGGAAGPDGAGGNAVGNVAGPAGPGVFQNGVAYQAAGRAGVGNSTNGIAAGTTNYGGSCSGGKANTNTDRIGGQLGGNGVVVLTWASPPLMATII